VYLDQSQVPFYLLFAIQNWLNLVLELMVAGLITVICGLAVGLRSKVDPGYLGLALVSAVSSPVSRSRGNVKPEHKRRAAKLNRIHSTS
jgi:hypothetical protein